MSRVFIIHGYGGDPSGGWKPWLARRLKEKGFDVRVPPMPDASHPRKDAWVAEIARLVGLPRSDDVFVGHSLGCIAIIRYLETSPPGHHVAKAIFVAGFYEELGPEYDELLSFLDTPVDWTGVEAACRSFAVIHSDDDDSVPLQRGLDLAAKLGVDADVQTGFGHFSGDDGVMELPSILPHFPQKESLP